MKIIHNLYLLLLILPTIGFSAEEIHAISKEKNISKTFEVKDNADLNVTNSYGNINVYLWDESKISIQVNIKVSGNNEKKIMERINDIDVNFKSSLNQVIAATNLNGSNWSGNNYMSYEINYIIKIPKNGNINLSNKYGNISVEKLNGTSTIESKYGNVTLGQFNNKSNAIDVAYSKNSTINSIDKLNLKCQYSDVAIQKANFVNIDGNYNDVTFQNVDYLNLSSNYTKLNANSIQKAMINGNYLTLKLGEISSVLNINSNYSDIKLATSSKTDAISINGNYTNSKISCADNLAFDIDVALKYGSFKDDLGIKYTDKTEKNASKSFTGYYLSQGKSKINVRTNYGSLQLLNK